MSRRHQILVISRLGWRCLERCMLSWRIGVVPFATLSLCMVAGCKEAPSLPPSPAVANSSATPSPTRSDGAGVATISAAAEPQDDPRTPACLPTSRPPHGWKKHRAVDVYLRSELSKVLPSEELARWSYFSVKSLARCTYGLPHSSGIRSEAEVSVVELETADDAYGLLTCRCRAGERFRIGGETRVDRSGGGLKLHCWQGNSYVHAECARSDAETSEEMIRLMMYIAGHIRREDTPTLLDALPRDTVAPCERWLVRDPRSLPKAALDPIAELAIANHSRVLGLTHESLMGIGRYEVSGTNRPNIIWIVRYPTDKAAYDAFARYTKFIADPRADPVAESTNLLPVHGRYLVGTWTAEEESLQLILPRVRQLLPE